MNKTLFEVVDATSDEHYWTLGYFPTQQAAIAALDACTPDSLPGDRDEDADSLRIEIREHRWGWGSCGRAVVVREWTRDYDEPTDEYVWRLRAGVGEGN